MSPQFVTQVVTEQPRVMVVGEVSWLRQEIMEFYRRHDLSSLEFRFSEFVRDNSKILHDENVYKVIALLQWSDDEDLTSITATLAVLSHIPQPIVVILRVITPVVSQLPELRTWLNKQEQIERTIRLVSQKLPRATVILSQDVIPPHSAEWLPLALITEKLHRHQLIDPQIHVHLQHHASFFSTLSPFLVSPIKSERILIRGAFFTTSSVCNEMKRQYGHLYQTALSTSSLPCANAQNAFDGYEVRETKGGELPSLLLSSVQSLPSPLHLENQTAPLPQPESQPQPLPVSEYENTKKASKFAHTQVSHSFPSPNPSPKVSSFPSPALSSPNTTPRVSSRSVQASVQPLAQPLAPSANVARTLPMSRSTTRTGTQQPPVPHRSQSSSNRSPLATSESNAPVPAPRTAESRSQNPRSVPSSAPLPDIDQELQRLFQANRVVEKTAQVTDIVKTVTTEKRKSRNKTAFFYLGVGVVALGVGVLALSLILVANTFFVSRQIEQLATSTSLTAFKPDKTFLTSSSSLRFQIEMYSSVVPPQLLSEPQIVSNTATAVIDVSTSLSAFNSHVTALATQFLGQEQLPVAADTQNGMALAEKLYKSLSEIKTRFDDLEDSQSSSEVLEQRDSFLKSVEQQRQSLVMYQQLAPLLDLLLAKEEKKNFAIILQNNHELRPTGGFIQAVALLSVDKGSIIDTQVYNSYEIDTMVAGEVQAPSEIRDLIGESRLFFRDSNWDPDLGKSGEQMAWYVSRASNRSVDGLMVIDIPVLEKILAVIGPVEVSEFSEVITDKNIAERLEFHSEIQLVDPASKPEYGELLLQKILTKALATSYENVPSLLSAFNTAVQNKHAAVWFLDKGVQETFSSLGWTGKLVVPQCPSEFQNDKCVVDTLAINEANIGINKANYHTVRQDSHSISLSPTKARHLHTISFSNTAKTTAWPQGAYKTYLRFYFPKSASLASISIDGTPLSAESYKTQSFDYGTVVGLVVEVPIKTKKQISVEYATPLPGKPFAYTFFNQKQLGTAQPLMKLELNYESGLEPHLIAPEAIVGDNQIQFHKDDQDHWFVGVSFQ